MSPFLPRAFIHCRVKLTIPVDGIICDEIIPALRTGSGIDRGRIISLAEERFQNQLAFARERRWREPGMSVAEGKHSYAALFGFEYSQDIEAELAPAWADVAQALTNFLEMSDLLKTLREASQYPAIQSGAVTPV
jgi:hypothetical protein